jgi:hypothetical protein
MNIGERYAQDAIDFARLIKSPDFLGNVLMHLAAAAQAKPHTALSIEIGFLNRIARLAYVGSGN